MSSAIAVSQSALNIPIPERQATDAPPPPPPRRAKPPGPGLPEAILWAFGFFVLQLVSGAICYLVMFGILAFTAGIRHEPLPDFTNLGAMELQIAGIASSVLAVFMLIGLVWWRLGRFASRKLNFSRPSLKQTVILASLVLPLMSLSGLAYDLTESALQWLTSYMPGLAALSQTSGIPHIEQEIVQFPLWLSLFSIAVLPAIGEEFLCRGLLGRGLVARWGIVRGVLLTSILFGLLHLYPPHVASAFVLGVTMHIVYLATRSFWAPILYHFLNNATVVVAGSLYIAGTATEPAARNWYVVIGSLAYVVFALAMLWRYRTTYVDGEGYEPAPEYPTVAAPVRESLLVRTAPNSRLALAGFSAAFVLFFGILAIDIVGSRIAAESNAQTAAMTDGAISELLIGRWDSGTQFNADGTFESAGTIEGEAAPTVIRGVWDVTNGVLRAEVTGSESPQIADGATLYWEVVSIDDAACQYRTSAGEVVVEYRVIEMAEEPVAARG